MPRRGRSVRVGLWRGGQIHGVRAGGGAVRNEALPPQRLSEQGTDQRHFAATRQARDLHQFAQRAVVETQALSRLLEPGQELLQAVVLERRSDTALEPAGDRGPKPAVRSQASGTGAGGISTPLKETGQNL